jgi:hypothetical protein
MADAKAQPTPKPAASNAPKSAAQPATPGKRPLGVTIFSILGIIASLLVIMAGVMLVGLMGVLETATGLGVFAGMGMIIGVVYIILGIVELIAYIMLFKMKRIGWIIVTVLGIIFIIMGLAQDVMSNIISVVITAIILIYLYTKRQLYV